MHPLERVLHQASVVVGTTASLGLGYPHQRMEGRQVTDVLKVITVPRAPQHHCPVPLGITATKPETVISPTACLVLQVGTNVPVAYIGI